MRMVFLAVTVAIAGLLALAPANVMAADSDVFTQKQVEGIEAIVQAYVRKHPELILEAVETLRDREQEMTQATTKNALTKMRGEIENDPDAPVLGNPKGDVTVVEFFDYRCGYCKVVFPTIMKAVTDDGKTRLVMKELPVLAPDSEVAARAALAAHKQGKYAAFHQAAMKHRGAFDEESLKTIAGQIGVNVARLFSDMNDPAIEQMLSRNRDQAGALGLSGTPAFIIGDTLVPGKVELPVLKELIGKARLIKK